MLGPAFGPWWWGARRVLQNVLQGIFSRLDDIESAPRPEPSADQIKGALQPTLAGIKGRCDELTVMYGELEGKLKDITFAVSEGIERTDRAERRIHATLKRARAELKKRGFEDPGLEAEAHELRIVNGEELGEGGVPTLPEGVEPPVEAPSSIRNVPATALARVRRF